MTGPITELDGQEPQGPETQVRKRARGRRNSAEEISHGRQTLIEYIEAVSDRLDPDDYEAGHGRRRRLRVGRSGQLTRRVGSGGLPTTKRFREYHHLTFQALKARALRLAVDPAQPLPSDEELSERAAELVLDTGLSDREGLLWDAWAPSSTVADEELLADSTQPGQDSDILVASVLAIPAVAWLARYMARKTATSGPVPARRLPVAVILRMCWTPVTKAIEVVRRDGWEGNALAGWAYDYPHYDVPEATVGGPRKSRPADGHRAWTKMGFNGAVHRVLAATSNIVLEHIMVDLARQAHELHDTDANDKRVKRHPKSGIALVVDGSFTEAVVRQRNYSDEEHRRIMLGDKCRQAAYRIYDGFGRFAKSVLGYKLVVLVDMGTGRPVIACLIPANDDEARACAHLLHRLQVIWPGHPYQYLVGDGLFGRGKQFLRTVIGAHGIIPVFPWRADYGYDDGILYRRGVPMCQHGPMKFEQLTGSFWSAKKRAEGKVPAYPKVQPDIEKLRIRWICPAANGAFRQGGCRSPKGGPLYKYTYPWEQPNIFSMLPHTRPADGDCKRASLRMVLLTRRNIIESTFSALQRIGLQGKGGRRPQFAGDFEMQILLMLGLIFLSAKRLAYDLGIVDRIRTEAQEAAVIEIPSPAKPWVGPTAEKAAELRRKRTEWAAPAEAPDSIARELGTYDLKLTGSATWDYFGALAEDAGPTST